MIKREEIERGCFSRVADDEPVFVLRGKDRLAPRVIRYWADRASNLGIDGRKIDEALKLAHDMEEWQEKNGCKYPD